VTCISPVTAEPKVTPEQQMAAGIPPTGTPADPAAATTAPAATTPDAGSTTITPDSGSTATPDLAVRATDGGGRKLRLLRFI